MSGEIGRERVLGHQVQERRLIRNDLLHSVESALADLGTRVAGLSTHQLVDLRFPGGCRLLLVGIPLVVRGGTEPDVHLRARVEIEIGEAKQAGFVIEGLGDALDERGEIQSDHIQPDADGFAGPAAASMRCARGCDCRRW